MRLAAIERRLMEERDFLKLQPMAVVNVLVEMEFQLGAAGLRGFKKMWAALKRNDYEKAKAEGLDSKWAKQTPERANELMGIIGSYF